MENFSEILDCLHCLYDKKCCSMYGVTLSKDEIHKFKGKAKIVPLTENKRILGYVAVLSKKENGRCIFQNDTTGLCEIYEDRPQACRNFSCIGKSWHK